MSGRFIFYCLSCGGIALVSYIMAAVLHEGGHALFGWLFGGRCLWIRLGRFLWVPGGGILTGRKASYSNAGECVLICPDQKSLIMAALGGPAVNLLSGFAVWAVFILKGGGEFFFLKAMGWMVFAFSSLLMAFFSLFLRGAGEENDGSLAWGLYREKGKCKKMKDNQQRDFLRLEFGLMEEMF